MCCFDYHQCPIFQDPTRFGFGGSRRGENISLKAAAVQLATAALHNLFANILGTFVTFVTLQMYRIIFFLKAPKLSVEASTSQLALPCDLWSA